MFFSNDIFLKTSVAFLDAMSNFQIARIDQNNNVTLVPVKIMYAHPENYIARLQEENSVVKTNFVLPTMVAAIKDFEYASDRKLTKTTKIYINGNSYTFTATPYDIKIELNILSKNYYDLFQLIEQILIKFTPSLSLNIYYLGQENPSDSVPFIINSVSTNFPDEVDINDLRLMEMGMEFTARTNLYLPLNTENIIDNIYLNTYSLDTYKKFLEYTLTPVNPNPQDIVDGIYTGQVNVSGVNFNE